MNENELWLSLDWEALGKLGAYVDPWPMGVIPPNDGRYEDGDFTNSIDRTPGKHDRDGDVRPDAGP